MLFGAIDEDLLTARNGAHEALVNQMVEGG
jgi:hypothetical protein